MAERSRRVRRQISDVTEDTSDGSPSESEEDWGQRNLGPARTSGRQDSSASATPSTARPKRTAASGSANSQSSATIHRSSSGSPDDRRQSIRLTVKVPPSKLREVMRANEVEALQDVLGGGKVLDGPRSRRAATARKAEKPRYAEYGESDIEDDDEEEEEDELEEEEDEEEDEEVEDGERLNDFDDIGGEPEGGTDDEDEEMEDLSPPKQLASPKTPKITFKAPSNAENKPLPLPKPRLVVTPAQTGPLKSVEDQEMEDDPGDEEVDSSELSDDDDGNGNGEGEEEEGDEEQEEEEEEEEEDAEGEGEGEDEEMEDDSSDETPGSGMATPDLSKMTKRQRGQVPDTGELMALDMAPQQRKFFTDQEKAMKKDEHARKRKELTKRKIQEEKAAALNRLLKPQASKARGGAPRAENGGSQADDEDYYYEKANPLYTRWVSNKGGIKLGVPEEWLGKKVGKVFSPQLPPSNGKMVQELD